MDRNYGSPPKDLGELILTPSEFCYVQDMVIGLPNTSLEVPEHLSWIRDLLYVANTDMDSVYGMYITDSKYVYVTVKHLPVKAGAYITRPGWHADSFGEDDITYIWSDVAPTEFSIQPFNLSDDCDLSLQQMAEQAVNVTTFGDIRVLRLDQYCIHRPAEILEDCIRTFVKVIYSDRIFALEGNARNPLLPTDWVFQPRRKERNHPWGEDNVSNQVEI